MRFWKRPSDFGFRIPVLSHEERTQVFPDTDCTFLNGKLVSQLLYNQCREFVSAGTTPRLVAVLAGEDPASEVYIKNKAKTFHSVGFLSDTVRIPSEQCTRESLLDAIDALNADPSVHGILLQLPLPKGIDSDEILARISPAKDVDGFLAHNAGKLALGDFDCFVPCTPFGVMALLASYQIPLAGKRAVVVGRSNIVGKPMSLLLLSADCTVTVAHSKTANLPALCREADILVAAVGKPMMITKHFVKPGAVVVDVGIHRTEDGKICGDVCPSVVEVASAYTPVPGGVGPLTIAMLCLNTAAAAAGLQGRT